MPPSVEHEGDLIHSLLGMPFLSVLCRHVGYGYLKGWVNEGGAASRDSG